MDVDYAGARGDVASQITFSREEFATVVATALVQTAGRLPISIELWCRLKEYGINRPEHELPAWAAFLSDHCAAKERGNRLYAEGNYSDAAACYTHGINMCPSGEDRMLATLYHNRAATYERLSDFEKVLQDCSSALSRYPGYTKALIRRARANLVLEYPEEAFRDALAAAGLENCSCADARQVGLVALSKISQTRAAEYKKLRKPQLPSPHIIRKYLRSFAKDPLWDKSTVASLGECPLSKALGDIEAERYEDVVSHCTAELEANISEYNVALALLLRAMFSGLQGMLEEAETDLDVVIDIKSVDNKVTSNALVKKARISSHRQQSDLAMSCVERAEQIYPENGDVCYQRGLMKLDMHKFSEAADEFEKCLTLSPGFVPAAIQKAYCEYRLLKDRSEGDQKDCLLPLEKLTELYPDVSEGYLLLGQALQDCRLYGGAREAFGRARSLDPTNAAVLVHEGLLLESSNEGNGEQLLHEALMLDERCDLAYWNLGARAIKRGDTEAALGYFKKLLPLAKSEKELVHVWSLLESAEAQLYVREAYEIDAPFLGDL